jgi:NifB/MoaA-like Fe-S oxidoreductase
MYLTAGLELPQTEYYDDGALYENGVGAVRRFVEDFQAGLGSLPDLEGHRVRLVTGHSMAPFISARTSALADATHAEVEVVDVTNEYFGDMVTVAGLLGGTDMLSALGDENTDSDIVVIPAEALNADEVFIDGVSYDEFEAALGPARIVRGYEITEALRSL